MLLISNSIRLAWLGSRALGRLQIRYFWNVQVCFGWRKLEGNAHFQYQHGAISEWRFNTIQK